MSLARRAGVLEMRLKRGEGVDEADVPALAEAFEAWRGEVHATALRESLSA